MANFVPIILRLLFLTEINGALEEIKNTNVKGKLK